MALLVSHETSMRFFAAFSYAASSVLILIFNKIVLSEYKFNFPVLMTLCHMLVTVGALYFCRSLKLLNFYSFDIALVRKALPMSLCFVLNIVVGMVALHMTTIPMFATLRRLTVAMVLCYESMLLHKRPLPMVVVAVATMILGSLIGGWGDLQFTAVGYFFVLLNNAVTALYLVGIKKAFLETRLEGDTFGVMYYNALCSIPALFIFALLNGELLHVHQFPHLHSLGFQLSFLISALISFGLNYSIFWCTKVNSALTTSVTGQVKNVLSSFVSIIAFGVHATNALMVGLSVGLIGSFLYAYAIYSDSANKKGSKDASNKPKDVPVTDSLEKGTSNVTVPLLTSTELRSIQQLAVSDEDDLGSDGYSPDRREAVKPITNITTPKGMTNGQTWNEQNSFNGISTHSKLV